MTQQNPLAKKTLSRPVCSAHCPAMLERTSQQRWVWHQQNQYTLTDLLNYHCQDQRTRPKAMATATSNHQFLYSQDQRRAMASSDQVAVHEHWHHHEAPTLPEPERY